MEGKVIAGGPGRKDDDGNCIPMDVAVGDPVLYAKYGGTEVKLEDKKWGAPTITHDGVTVAKEIKLEEPLENMGAQLE